MLQFISANTLEAAFHYNRFDARLVEVFEFLGEGHAYKSEFGLSYSADLPNQVLDHSLVLLNERMIWEAGELVYPLVGHVLRDQDHAGRRVLSGEFAREDQPSLSHGPEWA